MAAMTLYNILSYSHMEKAVGISELQGFHTMLQATGVKGGINHLPQLLQFTKQQLKLNYLKPKKPVSPSISYQHISTC